MSAFLTLLRKEAADTVRDLRLSVFALAYTLLMGLITFFFVKSVLDAQATGRGAVPSALGIALPLAFLNMLAVVIVTATFVLDGVGRERDEGMLGLLLTTRASAGAVLAAKIALGLLAYAALAVLGIVGAAILSISLGPVLLQAVAAILLGPTLVLFVFLLGVGLLVSVLAPSARIALAIGLAIDIPLFLLGATPLFGAITRASPLLATAIAWTPFSVATEGQTALISGNGVPWAHDAGILAAGIVCLVVAWLVFRRKEVTQG